MKRSIFIILIISFFGCSTTKYQKPKTTEQVIKPLKEGYIRRPILGINVKFTNGYVEIISVDQSEGAGKAGLKSGDIIAAINKKPVRKRIDLIKYLENKQIGEDVVVTIISVRLKRDDIYGQFWKIFR